MNAFVQEDCIRFAESFPLGEELRESRILITGATGLLGSIATHCLLMLDKKLQLNLQLTLLVRNLQKAKDLFGEQVNYLVADLNTADAIPEMADAVDYILHFASPTASLTFVEHPVYTIETIWNGTHLMLELARQKAVKGFVFVSSLEVYGTIHDDALPVTEEVQGYMDPMRVRTSYPMAKRLCECLCASYAQEYRVPVYVARLTQTFGAGIAPEDNRVFAQFARSIIQNKDIVLHTTGELARPYCYTTDAISAILYIMLKGTAGEAYNVANDETYISIRDMAEFLCKEFNPAVQTRLELGEYGYMPPTKLRLTSEKVERLGWKPTYNLHQMFERLLASLA